MIDNNNENSIRFCHGNEIDSSKIKVSSRAITRVSGNNIDNIDLFIDICNNILNEYRYNTKDIFLASFKNLRKDGLYRRRLDFSTAKLIMSRALEELWLKKLVDMI